MMKTNTSLKYIFWAILCFIMSTSVVWADDDGLCPTFSTFLEEGIGDHCLLCSFYEILMDACAKVVEKTWDTFAQPLQGVVALGASIYVAVYTLKNIGSFSQQDSSAYLSNDKTGVLPLMFKTAVIVALLNDSTVLYEYLIAPVISTGIAIADNIGYPAGFSIDSGFTASNVRSLFYEVIKKVRNFNDNIYQIVAIGRELLCLSFLPDGIFKWEWALIPFGSTLYIFGWFILIGVSFYLLDVLFRLAVGCILLPFAIACGISKLTISYTSSTWGLFVNVFFNFVMLGIIIQFAMDMILEAVSRGDTLEALVNAVEPYTADDASDIAEDVDVGTFTLTTVCCLVVFQLFMQVEQLADKISGTSSVGKTGQMLSAVAAQGAAKATTKTLKESGKLGGAAVRETALGRTVAGQAVRARFAANRGINSVKRSVKNMFGLR